MSAAAGRYFRLDHRQWSAVCDLGLHPALVYLALNAGRMKTTACTKWGAMAGHTHLGLPRARVRAALRQLEEAGLVRPVSTLVREIVDTDAPDYAWLPQSLVLGAADERSPLQLVRETGDPLLLRLLVDLYTRHELLDDGGLPLRVLSRAWKKTVLIRRSAWTALAFNEPDALRTFLYTYDIRLDQVDPIVRPHLQPAKRRGGNLIDADWWTRCGHLIRLGLLQGVPRLLEGDDIDAVQACSLWPPHWPGHDVLAEVQVARAAQEAAEALLGRDDDAWDRYHGAIDEGAMLIVAVPTHMEGATLRTGFRLRYRPDIKSTRAWWAHTHQMAEAWSARYAEVIRDWSAEGRPAAVRQG